jgi:hypothetical protein
MKFIGYKKRRMRKCENKKRKRLMGFLKEKYNRDVIQGE